LLNIITIDYFLKADNVTNIDIDGEQTLLDADIVIVNPDNFPQLWGDYLKTNRDGKKIVYPPDSDRVSSIFAYRKKEIQTLLEKGKIIIVFACPRYVDHAVSNNQNTYVSNYDFLPFRMTNLKSGKSTGKNPIILKDNQNLFTPYFKAFKDELSYSAYLDIDSDEKIYFLVNNSNKPVGFTYGWEKGLIAFLPAPTYQSDNKKLIGVIVESTRRFFTKHETTPPPGWTNDYALWGETEINEKINALQSELLKRKEDISIIEGQKEQITKFKSLLFEQGPDLENIVIESFRLLGFKAENRKVDDLEHDIVFESEEGKGIAELEGKDNDAIHISKMDQLNRAVDEDFELTGSYSQGVLIGNHYRFTKPELRKEPFTEKVLIVAKKKNFGLLTTFEIYKAVQKVLEDPCNETLKKSYREKILKTEGQIIKLV